MGVHTPPLPFSREEVSTLSEPVPSSVKEDIEHFYGKHLVVSMRI